MRVFEAVAHALKECGVQVVFGLVGSDTVKVGALLESNGIRYYGVRHEAQAVMMADGYTRVSGRLGVALTSRGPGFTNAITAMTCAAKARSSVVLIAGDSAVGLDDPAFAVADQMDPKHVDQVAMCASAGITAARLSSPATAAADLRALINRATLGRAISVNIPWDVMEAQAGDAATQLVTNGPAAVSAPDPNSINAVVDLFEARFATQRPVILAGRGAIRAGARLTLERLGEITGALLATTLAARSFFDGSPYNIGVCGSLSSPLATELLARSDTVLVFGASLNNFTTYGGTIFQQKAQVIQIDSDPGAFARYTLPRALAIHADVAATASALVAEFDRRSSRFGGVRDDALADRIRAYRWSETFRDQSTDNTIDPRTLLSKLDEILPRDRTVVVELGQHMRFTAKYLGVPEPPAFVIPMESQSIGLGIGAAIGAAVANSSRLTILDVGDGGLLMSLGDLETAIRYRVPMVVVIHNNNALGGEVNILQAAGLPEHSAQFPSPSFAAIANAMGGEGHTVKSIADLDVVRDRLRNPIEGPFVLDCHVNPAVREESFHFRSA